MARARDVRLARLTAAATRVELAEDLNRCGLRAWVAVCAVVRDGLAQAGIDPARVKALRQGEAAELRYAEVAPHPETLTSRATSSTRVRDNIADGQSAHSPGDAAGEQFEELTASDDDSLAGIFAAKIGDIARRYQDGHEPDFANASLAELFAWCLARSAQGAGASAIGSA